MANKLSSGGISVETLPTIVNNKGVDGLDALLTPFTRKKIAACQSYVNKNIIKL